MVVNTNIDWWEKIIENRISEFSQYFEAERIFLLEHVTQDDKMDDKILDLGCGNGKNIDLVERSVSFVVGVDNDPEAVRDADFYFRLSKKVDVICRDVSDLRLNDVFDVVMHIMLLPNLGNKKESSMIEAAKVLKKGGKLLLSTYAETALEICIAAYEQIGAPIHDIDGESGIITFDIPSGKIISEQFSLKQLEELGRRAGLTMVGHQKVGDLAYLVEFRKQ